MRSAALAIALVLLLTLMLSACAGGSPDLPSGCNHGVGGDEPRPTLDDSLPVTAPVAADGVVYVGYAIPDPRQDRAADPRDQYIIAALRARDGTPLWRVQVTSEFVGSSQPEELAVADGVVLVLVRGGELIAVRASDGAPLWHARLAVLGTAWGGVLYSPGDTGVSALRLADGQLLWQQTPRPRGDVLIPLVVDGTNVYFAQDNGSVTALRADTGAVRWTVAPAVPKDTPPSGTPAAPLPPPQWYLPVGVADGQLYLMASTADAGEGILRLNTVDGTSGGYVLQHQPTGIAAGVNPLLAAGVLTVLIYPPRYPDPVTLAAYRVRPSLGPSAGGSQPLWRVPVPVQADELAQGTTIVRDAQTVYFEGVLGHAAHAVIAAFRLADGTLLWRTKVPWSSTSPSIAADSGDLFATEWGLDTPCSLPPVHQAPVIRALRGADGTVAWTQPLDAAR
jgi:outer membrane protein assembly factor BamB